VIRPKVAVSIAWIPIIQTLQGGQGSILQNLISAGKIHNQFLDLITPYKLHINLS
jgi:hypothetical protein